MFTALYILLGFLLFDFLVAACLYIRKEELFETPEALWKYQKTVALNKYRRAKTSKHYIPRSKKLPAENLSA